MENSLPLGVGDKQPRWRLLRKHSWRVVGRIPVFPPKHAVGQAWNADNDLDGLAPFKLVGNKSTFRQPPPELA